MLPLTSRYTRARPTRPRRGSAWRQYSSGWEPALRTTAARRSDAAGTTSCTVMTRDSMAAPAVRVVAAPSSARRSDASTRAAGEVGPDVRT